MSPSPESDLFQQVLFRTLCDALGFTGESAPKRHAKIVAEARSWFYDAAEYDDLDEVCTYAGYDTRRVRTAAQSLIEAKQSGDHSRVPDFWRDAFVKGRMPSFSAYAKVIDSAINRG